MRIRHNIDDFRRDMQRAERELTPALRAVGRYADARISQRAIGTYMRNTGRTDEKNSSRGAGSLRIQQGRLARAVAGSFGPGGSRESRTTIAVRQGVLEYLKEITVPYAAIHEYGGQVRVAVTARMRRFFWARFKATGDEKWKGMALSRKQVFVVNIDARPYLGPALDRELPSITQEAERQLFHVTRGDA